jgi:hypothetical protein
MSTQNDKFGFATPAVWHLAKIACWAIFKRSVPVDSAPETTFIAGPPGITGEKLQNQLTNSSHKIRPTDG